MGSTLLQKVWDLHTVRRLPTGQTQLLIGLHLVHEVSSPQALPDRYLATSAWSGWPGSPAYRTQATLGWRSRCCAGD